VALLLGCQGSPRNNLSEMCPDSTCRYGTLQTIGIAVPLLQKRPFGMRPPLSGVFVPKVLRRSAPALCNSLYATLQPIERWLPHVS
jgi:hypothetical protein